jgi:hypothetical protein
MIERRLFPELPGEDLGWLKAKPSGIFPSPRRMVAPGGAGAYCASGMTTRSLRCGLSAAYARQHGNHHLRA